MVVHELAARAGGKLSAHKSHTFQLTGRVHGAEIAHEQFVLAICDSYMNVSGGPVNALCQYYKIAPDNLIVIHDDLDLPAHDLRLKQGGGEGGHNGLKSISAALGTRNYMRLRIGVGRPVGRMDPADYVLAQIGSKERTDYEITVSKAADTIDDLLRVGFTRAQATLHTA